MMQAPRREGARVLEHKEWKEKGGKGGENL